MAKRWAIKWMDLGGSTGAVTYETKDLAWRAIHELLEEAFGENYGEAELAKYEVVEVCY